jgi:multiple sugar transport system substrate-binding protein
MTMKHLRLPHLLVAALLLASFIVACTQAPTPGAATQVVVTSPPIEITRIVAGTPETVIITATPAPTTAAEVIELRFSSPDSAQSMELTQSLVDTWNSINPNVHVIYEASPEDYTTKLLTQFGAGEAPDIFFLGIESLVDFQRKGTLLDLTPLADEGFYDQYNANIAEFLRVDGVPYGVSREGTTQAIFYNTRLFDEAGVAYPQDGWTWDDVLATAQALTKTDADGNVTQWGIRVQPTWLRNMEPWVYQNGGEFLSPDGTTAVGYLNSPETVAAYQFVLDLITVHHVAPSIADQEALPGVDLFRTGRVAMNMTGMWNVNSYEAAPDEIQFGIANLPTGPVRQANAICWAAYAVNSQTEHPDAARAFVKYLGGEAGAGVYYRYGLVAIPEAADTLGQTADPHVGVFLSELDRAWPLVGMRCPTCLVDLDTPVNDAVLRYLEEGGDLQALFDEAAELVDENLAASRSN